MKCAARTTACVIMGLALGAMSACTTLHSQMTSDQMTNTVQKHFDQGMNISEVQAQLRALGADEFTAQRDPNTPVPYVSGDMGVVLYPKKFLGSEGLLDTYNRDLLLFRFGPDNALDDVVWRPYSWKPAHGGPYTIGLDPTDASK